MHLRMHIGVWVGATIAGEWLERPAAAAAILVTTGPSGIEKHEHDRRRRKAVGREGRLH